MGLQVLMSKLRGLCSFSVSWSDPVSNWVSVRLKLIVPTVFFT